MNINNQSYGLATTPSECDNKVGWTKTQITMNQSYSDAITKIVKVLKEKLAADANITWTGLLPRDLNKSKQRNKILKVNSSLKTSCKDETKIYYLEQDRNWVHKD